MLVKEADNLLLPFLKHPNFNDFKAGNKRLSELTKQIQNKMKNIGTHPILGQGFVKVDEETKKMFLEYVDICKEGLKF
ncbi:MAG: hypothetical protein ABIG87_00155 [Patescibacteria group bacterium]